MPEKPKRRKNNKNKRNKNKNKHDPNKINHAESVSESCSTSVAEDKEEGPLTEENNSNLSNLSVTSNSIAESNNTVSNSKQDSSQDLNSNIDLPDLNNTADTYPREKSSPSLIPSDVEYVVESPEHSLKSKTKLNTNVKSKSLDNDDTTKIVDITEDVNSHFNEDKTSSIDVVDCNSIVVSDYDSDIEWEKTNDIQNSNITQKCIAEPLTTCDIPITVTQNDQARSLTHEEEKSLRNCLQKLPITIPTKESSEIIIESVEVVNHAVKHRLRKKASADDFVFHRLGPPRTLDVIDEEGSSESATSSRRQSYLNEKKTDNDDLDDDVFEDVKKREKYVTKINKGCFGRQIEQQCMLVDAKLKEPEVSEARGDWSLTNVEKMSGAELIYLTDTSSSTSSLYDNSEDGDESIATDASVRIITPTIEVTDTETLLKETFSPKSDNLNNKVDKRPVEIPTQVSHEPTEFAVSDPHEIVVLSTDNIKTNLTVKELTPKINENTTENIINETIPSEQDNNYDLEMKVLKCELNSAINNLIKEVSSDSECSEKNDKGALNRQDSSSSVESSQCTAKYNPTHSSLNDVANIVHDDISGNLMDNQNVFESNKKSHVKEVFEYVAGIPTQTKTGLVNKPSSLKDLCVKKVAKFPYGDKILEELASVSERLQNITLHGNHSNGQETINAVNSGRLENKQGNKMPYYPLPDLSSIEKVSLPTKDQDHIPPPIKPRNSSLKIAQDENHWVGMPTETEPVYVCLSPSQKMLMEKTNTVITKEDASQLVEMHKKFVDRRGYNECYDKNRKRDYQHSENPPVVPFKSQTGSRLLALIRDPAVTDNINSAKMRNHLQILDSVHRIDKANSEFNKKYEQSNFKPIPPPRTRKMSSSFYESDESSDFTDSSFRSIKSERKMFHFSTGNLSKEIEKDISSIQNMHRYYTDVRDNFMSEKSPRRPSLPKDLCDQQMEYIRKKEKEVEAEIRRLESEKLNYPNEQKQGPRAPLISETKVMNEKITRSSSHSMLLKSESELKLSALKSTKPTEKQDTGKLGSAFSKSQEELLRDKMYSEYISQMAQREERKQQKVIKITEPNKKPVTNPDSVFSTSMPALDFLDSKVNNKIEKEFIWKARERWNKLGIKDPETEDERDDSSKDVYREPKVIEHKIKVIEGGEEKDMKKLPSHLQEFVRFTVKENKQGKSSPAVWRPGAPTPPPAPAPAPAPVPALAPRSPGAPPPPPPPPVWSPGASPQTPRKNFRPVHFEETPPARRKFGSSEQNGCTSGSESEGRLRTSHSAPATGLNSLGSSSRLPRAQNPTVTLLQKAREGQLARGANYQQQERDSARLPRDRASPPKGDPVHALRREYASEGEADRRDYERGPVPRKMAHEKVEGIGPMTKDGMPTALRSEVKDQSKWYKKMYDTIHKNKYDDDYVTIRYKSRRGQQPQRVTPNKSQYAYFDPRSGYLSEPEGGLSRVGSSAWSDAYDSDMATSPRRRTTSVQEERRLDETSPYLPSNKYSTLASARASHEVYKNQPGRIENYVPGRSSVVDKEAKQWWDEVMDIFDGQISSTTSLPQASPKDKKDLTSAILSKSNMARALKESGYESDSTLVFRRRDDTEGPLSPAERRAAYRDLQAGGEPPLRGFRSPAPPRTDESEIEYIPISPTLTKIRVHKKSPQVHEVMCYPVTSNKLEDNKFKKKRPSFITVDVPTRIANYPPAPPRRISSRNSRTLQLVTSTVPSTSSAPTQTQSNVDFLKNKITHKLSRQNTQIISKNPESKPLTDKSSRSRIMSMSAPPAINRKNNAPVCKTLPKNLASEIKAIGTSSFGSPRKTLLPTEYSKPINSRYNEPQVSVVIEGGAGRRTPISNILDKVTPIDKLWSSEKRNERIEVSKIKPKAISKPSNTAAKLSSLKPTSNESNTKSNANSHKSRDMTRTAEKVQKHKLSNHTKSSPCLATKGDSVRLYKPLQVSSSPKSSTGIRNQSQIKTATVTNLKKKKSLDSVILRPRSVPCHESCSKKSKDANKPIKKVVKTKTTKKCASKSSDDCDSVSQFGDTSNDVSNFGSFEDIRKPKISSKDIKQTRDSVMSDSFFQHLFLGNTHVPAVYKPLTEETTSVLQKAKMFQSFPQDNYSTKSLNSYLIHRKPVSLSRFKIWDRYPSPVRIQSPRSISWPGRMYQEVRKFDSLSKCDEFGSNSSLATVRSRSEPPTNKLYFSQTSRPKSPTVIFHKNENKSKSEPSRKSPSPLRYVFTETSRPVSPKVIRKATKLQSDQDSQIKRQSLSPTKIILTETARPISPVIRHGSSKKHVEIVETREEKVPSTMFFSQTSRPVSPKVQKKSYTSSRSQSTSPVSIRAPSYRRIHSTRVQNGRTSEVLEAKKILRTRSADDAKQRNRLNTQITKTKSNPNIPSVDPDYDEYIRDMENSKARSDRFRELNRYYTYLERVGELEKATSTSDLRHRRKDEEIIDFDRWKKIRAIERAEEELNSLYRKLKIAQSEKDVLFYPKDLKDFRWNHDSDRGLRIKEKSVEDLKEHFQQGNDYDSLEYDQSKDIYKPLWRGTSVAETAFNINRKDECKRTDDTPSYIRPTIMLQDATITELRKKIGLGNRLWSSLSMEQVNALKNQLNAIYSKELESKSAKENDKYYVEVKDTKDIKNSTLHVRSNSLNSTCSSPIKENELSKSESIAAISCTIPSVKELKNNVNKIQMSLSENEKRKISQTLSKEIMSRINKFDNSVSLPETTVKAPPPLLAEPKEEKPSEDALLDENSQNIEGDSKTAVPLCTSQLDNVETTHTSSASETETGSSDVSNRTVIYRGPSEDVKKKVEYFESVRSISDQSKTIYHARENSDEKEHKDNSYNCLGPTTERSEEPQKSHIFQSQSCTNIKELFGESDKNKFLSLPSKPEILSRSPSPHSEVYVTGRRTPDTLPCSSDETIWRSRSPSPDPERYWRAYLNLARAGEVRRLARRFDSPTAAGAVLRRHRSDPELSRNLQNDDNPRRFNKPTLPVARVPLRPTNRYMPHIDIISKLAALRRRAAPRSRSAEEALECRPGEVHRIRRRFETMSLLGQIYASAPDMSELRDIAPYLAGPWVAHRYPKRSDNNRSIKETSSFVGGRKSPIKKVFKPVAKEPVKLSSILKSDVFAKQKFNAAAHRPASRYTPPRAPPRPPPAAWPQRLAPYVTHPRHTVTFQETDSPPEPPQRAAYGSISDRESPRRYVESDVNIHYRCPVRHDPLPLVPERELARQQAEHMKKLYREQRRHKYLQELQDMQNRRHQDNFTPSQKAVVPLNRYDEAERIVARALYAFNGQTPRELSFKKGDFIQVRRQIDSNWYEGELHGRIGLFPYNYVELLKGDVAQSPKKPIIQEGRARAKFDFTAQTNLELPLKKGEVVVLTRRIDQNWWEGRHGAKTGIFPDSYVAILQEPSQSRPEIQPLQSTDKPVASPAAHGLLNGSAKRSMGAHSYLPQPNSPALANAPPATQPLPGYTTKTAQAAMTPSERGYGPPTGKGVDLNNSEPLYVDTNAEAVPYRAMYKYRPQNPDELELNEGDTVYVLEKCDDGWYVGSSQRTGRFGTFPGNYVERI